MAEVVWAPGALRDLSGIEAYVGAHNMLAAQLLALRLLNAGNALSDSPLRGRPLLSGIRELTIVTPYLIRYAVNADVVESLDIRHGAREPD